MENSLLNIVCLPLILFVVLGVMAIYKRIVRNRGEALTRLIPIWAALLGAAISVYLYMKVPTLTLASDVLSAMLLGLVCGLSSVGLHQVGNQLAKLKTVHDLAWKEANRKVHCDKVEVHCHKVETEPTTDAAETE